MILMLMEVHRQLVISGDSEELGEFVGAEQEVRAHLQRLEKINGSEVIFSTFPLFQSKC